MKQQIFFLVFVSLAVVSCASRHVSMNGTVAMKINETRGVACLFGEEPRPGDKLELFKNDCKDGVGRGREGSNSISCKMVRSGEAIVTKMLNDHYAEFEVTSEASFEEGSILKLKK